MVAIRVESPLWHKKRSAKTVLRRAICQTATGLGLSGGEVSVVLTDDSAIRELNRTWRRRDMPTNVLSFPLDAGGAAGPKPPLLGDIVIAYETTAREAELERKSFDHHLAHLAVHGFLHLVGYDHETADEASTMEQLEILILARLDVPDPYLRGIAGRM
jgi:probable rRNA maturation factor